MTEKRRVPTLDELEREVTRLKPHHEQTISKVESAISHLAAATRDLEEVRRVERLASRR